MASKPRLRIAQDGTLTPTTDSFVNMAARVGIPNAGNLSGAARYGFNPITRNRNQLEWMYRGSWICGAVCDAIAEDMTREGVQIQSEDPPDDIEEFEKTVEEIQLWPTLCEMLKWGRLYGGAIGYLMIDGQDPKTPLNRDSIRPGQFLGVKPMDRWMVQPTLSDLVSEPGRNMGLPRYYNYLPDINTTGMQPTKIHYSRVIRHVGVQLPYWQMITEDYWGQSVIERLFDRLVAFDSTTQGAAQLVYKAHLRTYKIDKLREIIATGGAMLQGLLAQIDFMRGMQTNEGLTLMDKTDEFETHQYTFSGLDAVLIQFGQQLSGASGIPLVRLFGQSPAGLNSTGESDWRMYYDNIKRQQESELRYAVATTYDLSYRSHFGKAPDKAFTLKFKPLWRMTDEQSAEVTERTVAAVVAAYQAQLLTLPAAMKELRALSTITGFGSNITDDDIKEAESAPSPGELADTEHENSKAIAANPFAAAGGGNAGPPGANGGPPAAGKPPAAAAGGAGRALLRAVPK